MPDGVLGALQRQKLVRLFEIIDRAVDYCHTVWELLDGYIAPCCVSAALVRQAGVQLDVIRDAVGRARLTIGLPHVLRRRHHFPILV